MNLIDFSKLPAPQIVETLDFDAILTALKAHLLVLDPSMASVLDLESEPVTKLLEVFAYREMVLRNRINESAKAVMLPYASTTDLDNLASLFDVERLPNEDDSALRYRAKMAMEGLSNAGTIGSYTYHAFSASDQVKDVWVSNAEPGMVRVVILSKEGNGTPSQATLDAVITLLSSDDVKALCDTLSIQPAEVIALDLTLHLQIMQGPDSLLVKQIAQAQVEAFFDSKKLGESIALSAIYAAAHTEGVVRVGTNLSDNLNIMPDQAAALQSLAVTFEVV